MPSKLEHEFTKLRGEVSETGKVYTNTIAILKDAVCALTEKIKNLESEGMNQSNQISNAKTLANTALKIANGSLKKSGDSIVATDFKPSTCKATKIINDTITATELYHKLTPQSGTVDNLSTINGGYDGRIIILKSNGNMPDITIKNGTGNIRCGSDRMLNTEVDTIVLIYIKASSMWGMISYQNNL